MGGWMGSSFGGQMAFMSKDDGRHGGLQTKLGKRGFQSVSSAASMEQDGGAAAVLCVAGRDGTLDVTISEWKDRRKVAVSRSQASKPHPERRTPHHGWMSCDAASCNCHGTRGCVIRVVADTCQPQLLVVPVWLAQAGAQLA